MSRHLALRCLWKIAAAALAGYLCTFVSFAAVDPKDIAYNQQEAARAEAELNQVYQVFRQNLNEGGKTSLKTVQRAWIAFKEKDFSIYANFAKIAGDIPGIFSYMAQETRSRSAYLLMVARAQPRGPNEGVKSSREADQMLNAIYRECLPLLPPDKISSFKETQVLWIQFRDLHCQFDAAIRGRADDAELRETTMNRVVDLRRYLVALIGAKLPISEKDPREEVESSGDSSGLKPLDPFRFVR